MRFCDWPDEQQTEQSVDEPWPEDADVNLSPQQHTLMQICAAAAVLIIPIAGIITALAPGTRFLLGRRGSGWFLELDQAQGRALALAALGGFIALVLWKIWRSRGTSARPDSPADVEQGLSLGEKRIWEGRPKWRAITVHSLVLLGIGVAIWWGMGWWFWSIISTETNQMVMLFLLVFPLFTLFCFVLPLFIGTSRWIGHWLSDIFGLSRRHGPSDSLAFTA